MFIICFIALYLYIHDPSNTVKRPLPKLTFKITAYPRSYPPSANNFEHL